jgi:hypothetical protein
VLAKFGSTLQDFKTWIEEVPMILSAHSLSQTSKCLRPEKKNFPYKKGPTFKIKIK